MGWIGDAATLRRVLDGERVRKDDTGAYLVSGCVASFMGAGDEFIVGDDAYGLSEDGRRVHLATALGAQSFGLGVTVIGCDDRRES